MNFKELCEARYSCRAYETKPIEDEKLDYIRECVRLAPSAVNRQPWKFVLVTDATQLAVLHRCYDREWIKNAPAIVVCCQQRDEAWVRPCDGKNHADIDIAIAVEHLVLAAAEIGLGSCWVCNFDAPLLARTFPLPQGFEASALIPLGYPAGEPTAKKRKAVEEIWETR